MTRVKKLRIVGEIGGLRAEIAKIKLEKWGEEKKRPTIRITPCCREKPVPVEEKPWGGKYFAVYAYKCPKCGKVYHSWRELMEVDARTLNPIVREIPGAEKGVAYVKAFSEDQLEQYGDLVPIQYWVPVPQDKQSEKNLLLLALAAQRSERIPIIKWYDGSVWHTGYFYLDPEGKLLLVEFIPLDLLEQKAKPLDVDKAAIGPDEVAAAEKFVQMLPTGDKEFLEARDWRNPEVEIKPKPKKGTASLLELLKLVEAPAEEKLTKKEEEAKKKEGGFVCPYCGKVFETKRKLTGHMVWCRKKHSK